MSNPTYHIGTMGFAYEQWRNGVFYPAGMSQRQFLGYYSQRFNAVEMDSTYYGVPQPTTLKRWTAVTESPFIICPKTPRDITHNLGNAQEAMLAFVDTMRLLGDKLGPILIQFSPDFTNDYHARLADFLAAHGVEVVASLPCYLEENVDRQRGTGQLLTGAGFGPVVPGQGRGSWCQSQAHSRSIWIAGLSERPFSVSS